MFESMKNTLFLRFFLGFTLASAAVEAKVSKEAEKAISDVFSKYRKAAYVEMKVEKKVISELMGTEKASSGQALIGSKKFRFESESPEKALVVYNGKTLWNVQYPAEGAEGKTQAARVAITKKSRSQIFLLELLQGEPITKEFELSEEKKDGNSLQVTAKPKTNKYDLSLVALKFDLKSKRLSEVEYSDDLGNKTTFKLLDQKNIKKVDGKKFDFKPGSEVEVVDL